MLQDTENDVQIETANIVAALHDLKPSRKHCKSLLFAKLYPVIREMLAQHVTQKDILAVLAKNGLKLHPVRFKQLMAAEAEVRAADGRVAVEEGMA